MSARRVDEPSEGTRAVLVHATEMARRMAAATDGATQSVILYGSHLLGANPDRHSALDFVVVVEDYRRFYQGLRAAGEMHRPPWLMTAMAGVLAPNVIAFTPEDGQAGVAKCLILTREDFASALGPEPRDHFLLARMVQRVAVIWGSTPEHVVWVEERLSEARGGVLDWLAPYLEPPFDAEGVGRRLLEVCYQGEFRPEARNRADTIFRMQQAHFRDHFGSVLEAAAESGRLRPVEGGYQFTTPVTPKERRRWRRHFRRSKARVTARWLKHVLTFDNWLPYIARKVERRTGEKVELTPLERRMPLLFLWPRAVRILMSRPDREKRL